MHVLRKTFLSTLLILTSINSFITVNAQQNVDWDCVNFHKEETIILNESEYDEKKGKYRILVSRNLINKVENAGFTVYWLPPSRLTHRWGYTYHSRPEIRIPKYTEEELMKKCRI